MPITILLVGLRKTTMKHTTTVKAFNGTNEQLAEELGDLFYDNLAQFLNLLAMKIEKDSKADLKRGRTMLAKELHECARHLSSASEHIGVAWDISAPFVQKWRDEIAEAKPLE